MGAERDRLTRDPTPTMTDHPNPMTDVMQADDQIDALPEIGVMDCYVRSKLMRALMDRYRNHPDGYDADGFAEGRTALMRYSHDGVRCWALDTPAANDWVASAARNNRAEDFTIAVFDQITNDDWDRDKCISVARDYLKDHLSGSLGMPDDNVIRARLKHYD